MFFHVNYFIIAIIIIYHSIIIIILAPDHLNNITVNDKHVYDDLYDISISWDHPAHNPEYYNIKIIDLTHLLHNNQVDNVSIEFNVTGVRYHKFYLRF